jgi:Ca2+-binding RTX toxin-like protein
VTKNKGRRIWTIALTVAVLGAWMASRSDATVPSPHSCEGAAETVSGNTGTSGNDVIVGTSGADVIHGRGGNDLICGAGGADTIYGEAGADRLVGEAGADKLFGGIGNDHIVGYPEFDSVVDGQLGRDCTPSGAGTSIEYACPNPTSTSTTLVAGQLECDPTSYGFGDVPKDSAPRSVVVTCKLVSATGTVQIGTVVVYNITGDGFSIGSGSDSCTDATLNNADTCQFTVVFTPRITGTNTGFGQVPHNGSNASPINLSFSGQAIPSD